MASGLMLIIDARECTSDLLTDGDGICDALADACKATGATIREELVDVFEGTGGITAAVTLGESGAMIHTYPETWQWFAEVFTCGGIDPTPAFEILKDRLGGHGKAELRPRGVG